MGPRPVPLCGAPSYSMNGDGVPTVQRRATSAALTVLALAVVLVALTVPDRLEDLAPGVFLRLPVELLGLLAVVLALPDRLARWRGLLALLASYRALAKRVAGLEEQVARLSAAGVEAIIEIPAAAEPPPARAFAPETVAESPVQPVPEPSLATTDPTFERESAATLFERLEAKLEQYPGQLTRACVELTKDWRTDRYLRRLEAMMLVADKEVGLLLSGSGDVLEPEGGIMAIGSGGNYALAAARALADSGMDAEAMVRRSLSIAAEICVYTNGRFVLETL